MFNTDIPIKYFYEILWGGVISRNDLRNVNIFRNEP